MIEIGKNRKGMTLVELMLAIFIMTIIITSAMSIAAIYLKGRSTIKKSQDNIEEMSLALNMLAKELRMSNCDTDDSDRCSFNNNIFKGGDGYQSITVVDNNDIEGDSHTYEFDAAGLKKDNDILVSGVTGKFYVFPNIDTAQIPPSPASGDPYFSKRVPRITIMMEKDDGSGQPIILQTTVSMRGGYQDVN